MKQLYSHFNQMVHLHLKFFAFFILLATLSSFNDYKPIGTANVSGNFANDYDLNFAAAAPGSYLHSTGVGGTWGNGDKDHVVESLQGGDFSCGERVVFFTKITVNKAGDDQTLDIDYAFGSKTTSGNDLGFGSIESVQISSPDAGNSGGSGNTAISILNAFAENNGALRGTVQLTGLDQGEVVIVRIVGILACNATSGTGNIQSSLESGGGTQTVPLKQAGQILETGCSLPSQDDVCEGTTTTHTATAEVDGATFDWTLTGNATFAGGGTTKQTTAGSGQLSSSVDVVAGSPGSYTLSVIISKPETTSENCDVTVTIKDNSAAPSVNDLCAGATEISGSSSEADGTTIEIFKGANSLGTTTVTAGVWSKTVSALAAGDVITAKATASGECQSVASTGVTVADNSAAPTVNPLCAGATTISGTSSEGNGTSIAIFKNGNPLITTTVTNGLWSKAGLTALVAADVITAKATATGECQSVASADVTVADNSAAPTVNPLCAGATTISGSSSEADGTTIEIFKGANSLGTTTVTAGVWSKTVSALSAGDVITAKATATGECQSAASTGVTVQSIPSITVKNISNICPANTANLTTAVLTNPSAGTLTYFMSNCTTPVADPTAAGAGTYCIKVTKNGCSSTKTVTVTINSCTQGCTPGYWKNRKAGWNTAATNMFNCVNGAASNRLTASNFSGDLKNALFKTVFNLTDNQMKATLGNNNANLTLLGAVGLGDGSGYTQLARAATAALLNSCALTGTNTYLPYPYNSALIITNTNAIFTQTPSTQSRADAITLARTYDIANNNVCTLDNSSTSARLGTNVAAQVVTQLTVTTFPNPYSNKVRFSIANPTAGQGSLEVFNMLGQKVKTVYQGYMPAGNQTYDLTVPGAHQTNLIYILRVGDKRITGKLMQLKQ